MTTATKELGKYEIIPSTAQLHAIKDYIEKNKDAQGNIDFSTRMLFESDIVSPYFGSISYLNGVVTYLLNEDWLERTALGHAGIPSSWNVNHFLSNIENILTREKAGRTRPKREVTEVKAAVEPEVEIVRKPIIINSKETPAVSDNNASVMVELKNAMTEMVSYLQNLPIEMGGHLNSIANKLEATDENLIANLRAEISSLQNEKAEWKNKQEEVLKDMDGFMEEIDTLTNEKKDWEQKEMDLTNEVQRLNTQLEEVGRNNNYSKHHIYRQRNMIMDEVDRMINSPAWTMKQNSVAYRNSIESKLNEIMGEIGIDGNE
jgi:uncharacterized protein YoxC